MTLRTAIIPGLRYRDAPAAIDFLCRAFGFARHAVFADPDDPAIVHHAQLVLDGAMIMLGSARDDEATRRYRWRMPDEAGGVTSSLYVVVTDPDRHAAQAEHEGAEIVDRPNANQGYSGRGYSARDPEGYVWSFGSYDPWAA